MKHFNNLKLRHKFLVIGIVVLPFVLGLGTTGIWGVLTVNSLLQQTQHQQLPSIYELAVTSEKVQLVRNANRQTLAETDPAKIQQAVDKAHRNLALARQHWNIYLPLPAVEQEKAIWPRFEAEWQAWNDETEQVLTMGLQHTPEAIQKGLDLLALGHGQNLTDLLAELISINYQGATELAKEANRTLPIVIILIVISGIIVLAITLIAGVVLARSINRPLNTLSQVTQALAKGDLTQRVEIGSRDELGELGQTYNMTLTSLQQLVRQLYVQSHQLSLATSELSNQAKSQVVGSGQQAGAITEASRALEELNQTARLIALQTHKATQVAEETLQQARSVSELAHQMAEAQTQGHEIVAGTIQSIQNLRTQLGEIEGQQQTLVVQSSAIERAISMIDNLAKETHLLSLNASIEAAGAGTMGIRFAVIASEVKSLADRSIAATQEIRKSLGGISLTIEETSKRSAHGLREAEQAVAQARNSNTVLASLTLLSEKVRYASSEIVVQVQSSTSLTSGIGVAIQQQEAASQEMLEKMLEIEAITSQTLSNIRQGEIVTQQISASADELEQSARAFKLNAA